MADTEIITRDPVCGMSVDRATARHMAMHTGERFYFCSAGCHDKFEAAPESFLGDRAAPSRCRKAPSTPARWTRRSCRKAPATARSAAWRWSR